VAFYATLENMRDILKRSRTGMAVTSTEEQFYQDLLGSQITDPRAFKIRMEEAINREDLGAKARYETALEQRRGNPATPEELKRIPTFKRTYRPISGVVQDKKVTPEAIVAHKAAKAQAAPAGEWSVFGQSRQWKWDEGQGKYVAPDGGEDDADENGEEGGEE
jgi:hypothetical protein